MPQTATRTRLALTRLDDRTVPSTVAATTTARPFDFVATGTLTTIDTHTTGATTLTDTSNSGVTLAGSINYASNTAGASGIVTLTGTGTGSETPKAGGGRGAYAQTVLGEFAFADADGTVTADTTLTGTRSTLVSGGASAGVALGPVAPAGTFDVSTFQLQTAWGGPSAASSGSLTATLADATSVATDLAFGTSTASREADGTVTLDFSAVVTGNLLKAASRTAAASHVTATWEGSGQTAAVDLDLPVYWNTGTVAARVAALTPPAWATTLTVRLDAGQAVTEGDETNNTWVVDLVALAAPTDPPVDPVPADPTPVVPPAPPPFPRFPSDPQYQPVRFAVVPGQNPVVNYIDPAGRVIGAAPALDKFDGQITVAAGDVNHDGVVDAVVAAGDGGGPRVQVLDGMTGTVLANFFAFDPDFRGGASVSVTDLNGDGYADIVAAAGVGGGPHVKVFDGKTGTLVTEFLAFAPDGRGGVSVALADLDRDGVAEIIAGAGDAPELKVFDARTGVERFHTSVAADDARTGVKVSAYKQPDGTVIVTADPNGDAPVKRFRNQMLSGGPLLEELIPPAVGVVVG